MAYNYLQKNLTTAISYLEERKFIEMRKLGDLSINLAINQNEPLLAELAVILYSLHKMCSKPEFEKNSSTKHFFSSVVSDLQAAKQATEERNRNMIEKSLMHTLTKVEKADTKLSYYIRNVIEKARIRFASIAYSQGMSLSQACELTKAEKSHVLDYIGATKAHEEYLKPGIYEKVEEILELKRERGDSPIRVVCDSSTIISLSQSCQIFVLRKLSKIGFVFLTSKKVVDEIVHTPYTIKRFELSSLRIKYAIQKQYLEEKEDLEGMQELTEKYYNTVNSAIQEKKRNISIIQNPELEALALSEKLGSDFTAIDEFTTRAMVENPKKLLQVISRRRGANLTHNSNLNFLRDTYHIPIIRSSDLIAFAFLKGLLTDKEEKTLEASLYGVKYSGCAVATKEIEDFLQTYKNLKM